MQRQAVLHWNRRLECLNRISQKALERKSWVLFSCSNFRRKCRATGEVELCYPSCGMTDYNSFGAEYRGATFVGVERQSLHQVKGRSPAQFIVVATISTGYYLPSCITLSSGQVLLFFSTSSIVLFLSGCLACSFLSFCASTKSE